MRRPLRIGALAGVAGVLVLTAVAVAQNTQQNSAPRSPWKYYPQDRSVGDGGPAPKRDLTGTWAGPQSGASVPRSKVNPKNPPAPPMTALGQELFARNKPLGKYSPAGTNDPHVRFCDPYGFPQNMTNEIRGMTIASTPTRTFILLQYMNVWREVWTDGRTLPTNVGGRGKDTLDPKLYTQPFYIGDVHFRWIPNQIVDDFNCIPSELDTYLKQMGDPAGSDPTDPRAR